MLLSYLELVDLIKTGVVRNTTPAAVNSTSIDLTLGGKILTEQYYKPGQQPVVHLCKREPLKMDEWEFEDHPMREVLYLQPGQFILAQTEQVFYLPDNISAEYKLKSSMARVGLEHLNAGWCDAGWNGSVLTLELRNMTEYHVIALRKGDPIGQMVFFRHFPVPKEKSYAARGRYNNDKQVTGVKE